MKTGAGSSDWVECTFHSTASTDTKEQHEYINILPWDAFWALSLTSGGNWWDRLGRLGQGLNYHVIVKVPSWNPLTWNNYIKQKMSQNSSGPFTEPSSAWELGSKLHSHPKWKFRVCAMPPLCQESRSAMLSPTESGRSLGSLLIPGRASFPSKPGTGPSDWRAWATCPGSCCKGEAEKREDLAFLVSPVGGRWFLLIKPCSRESSKHTME